VRRPKVGVLIPLVALGLVAAAPARADRYEFVGDKGTDCTVDVTADASHVVGALSGVWRVGFASDPACVYRESAAGGSQAGSGGPRWARACKSKRAKRHSRKRIRGCKSKRKHRRARSTTTRQSSVTFLDLANLDLIGPLVTVPGEETLASAGLGGYTCLLDAGANCSDSGQLEPAIPGLSYHAQFSIRLTPPAGETWVSRPAGCSAGLAAQCVLISASVSPTL
jgi:hypothetical protein